MRLMLRVTGVLIAALVATLIDDLRLLPPGLASEVVMDIKPWAPPLPTRKPVDEPLLQCVCEIGG